MLVSVGRQANTQNIGLENTDIVVEKGYIQTNEFYQTKESHIYAIGDVIGTATRSRCFSRRNCCSRTYCRKEVTPIDYSMVSKCVYSSPEVASVGLTEQEAKEKGYKLKVGKFSFRAIGKHLYTENQMVS